MSLPDMDLEAYLATVENVRRTESDQVLHEMSRSDVAGGGVISANAVQGIMDNLVTQMEGLNKQLTEARGEDSIKITPKDENIESLIVISAPSPHVTCTTNLLLPFESSTVAPITTSETVSEFLNRVTTRDNPTRTTFSNVIYTQTPTTTRNTEFGRTFQPINPINTAQVHRNRSETFTTSQFDIIQQQLSILTQTVSLLTVLVNSAQKPKLLEPKVNNYEHEQNLSDFLTYFEQYCEKRYPQSPDQWLRLLEKYLTGKFLRLYNVITKTVTDYTSVKNILLKWYNQEEKKRNENKLKKYHSAKRQPGEDINLFALRLEQLACQAFPGVNMREHESLRTAFILSLSPTIQHKLREFIIQNEMITQTKVSWEKLVMLADSYDREFRPDQSFHQEQDFQEIGMNDTHRVNEPQRSEIEVIQIDTLTPQATWSEVLKRGSLSKPNRVTHNNTSQNNRQKFSPLNKNPISFNRNNNPQPMKDCSYCGKIGHTHDECYKALGICSYCKTKGHIRKDCWHYNNSNNSSTIRRENSTVTCSFCRGNHLGMDCTSRNRNEESSPRKRNSDRNQNQASPNRNRNQSPLPQRIHHQEGRTFENSSNPWIAQGAKPKTLNIEDCRMCGDSHVKGKCAGDPGNFPTPQ
ncbi:UNVERIFIED_CONTAM: hypothetical protein RMT77_018339 [Armadillidium vulgare]